MQLTLNHQISFDKMNPIKVGLIGFGRMGGFYLEQMQKSEKWEIAYICDTSEESREYARKKAPVSHEISFFL